MEEVFIISAKRSPIGGFLGQLSGFTAIELGAKAIEAAVSAAMLEGTAVDSVYMGNVLSANLGQAPARQAAKMAGLPDSTDASTINKVCSSGLKAVIIGSQQIALGLEDVVVAGGMESMSRVPHYMELRTVHKLGDRLTIDGLQKDGLTDVYHQYHMGVAAELCASHFGFSRKMQDDYACASYEKAIQATENGLFHQELVSIELAGKAGSVWITEDEDIRKLKIEKIARLQPAFVEHGTITAANASNLNDGAAALVLASKKAVEQYSLRPLAKIIAYADAAQAPEWFTTAPAIAAEKALARAGLSTNEIDFFEINEAYSAVALANWHLLRIPEHRLNVHGGAVAMGHPLGASGARILCSLVHILHAHDGRYGLAAICNGGGGASSMIIERM
jgi:acetyl-CoA C-acetyltransferase